MNRIFYLLTFSLLSIGFTSCDGIVDESKQIAKKVKNKTTQELEKYTRKITDKIFPQFDSGTPDTENNKKRFKDFLKVDIPDDVKNIYCHAEPIGIDKSFSFTFKCNQATSDKIIAKNKLTLDSLDSDFSSGLHHDLSWWDKERIAELPRYNWTNGEQYFKYYWYDAENEQAYFFDFDM